jgi:hypothetical protein
LVQYNESFSFSFFCLYFLFAIIQLSNQKTIPRLKKIWGGISPLPPPPKLRLCIFGWTENSSETGQLITLREPVFTVATIILTQTQTAFMRHNYINPAGNSIIHFLIYSSYAFISHDSTFNGQIYVNIRGF